MINECQMDRYTEVCKPRLDDLEQWQGRQNGSLQRIESKVDKLFLGVIGTGGGIVITLIVFIVTGR